MRLQGGTDGIQDLRSAENLTAWYISHGNTIVVKLRQPSGPCLGRSVAAIPLSLNRLSWAGRSNPEFRIAEWWTPGENCLTVFLAPEQK
jgi:hypothetical protein